MKYLRRCGCMSSSGDDARRQEIEDSIRRLGRELNVQRGRLTEYQNVKAAVESAIAKLNEAIGHLNTTMARLKDNYIQTGEPRYEDTINNIIDGINQRLAFLSGSVIPALEAEIEDIDNRISGLVNSIRSLQSQL